MIYERFTDRSRKIIRLAAKKAKQRGDPSIGVHHLLIALIEEGSGLAANVLKKLNVDVKKISDEAALSEPAYESAVLTGHLLHSLSTDKAIRYANEIANAFGHNYVGTEHLLLGILKTSHPVVTEVLNNAGVDYHIVRKFTLDLLAHENNKMPPKEEITINFYNGVLRRIMKVCEENSDNSTKEIKKIVKRAILDGVKWNIS